MTHPRRAGVAAAVAVVAGAVLLGAGPALAEPPDGYAPTPPTPPRLPALTMSSPSVVEGTGGVNEMVFTFELDAPAGGGETFRFHTEDAQGTALPVEDHDPVLAFPVFGAGETELTVAIPLVTDGVPEADETILVHMDQPTGLTIADGAGTGTILDDDERRESAAPDGSRPTTTTATPTKTTTATPTKRTAALELRPAAAATREDGTTDLRPVAAVALVALAALSVVAAWRERHR